MKKTILKTLIATVALVCLAVSLSGCIIVERRPEPEPEPSNTTQPEPQPNPGSTARILQDFNNIDKSMTLSEVNDLIGRPGKEWITDTYEWYYADGYTLRVSWFYNEIDGKSIEYDDDYSIFVDNRVNLSGARSLYSRIDGGEKVSYNDFVDAFGTYGIVYDVGYYSSGDTTYYCWMTSNGDYVKAGFDQMFCRFIIMNV